MMYHACDEVCQKCRSDLMWNSDHETPKAFCVACAHEKLKRENETLRRQLAKRDAILSGQAGADTPAAPSKPEP